MTDMTDRPEEPRAMKEIHDIRAQIQEETKDMTPEEISAFYANAARDVEKMYGITFRRAEDRPARTAT